MNYKITCPSVVGRGGAARLPGQSTPRPLLGILRGAAGGGGGAEPTTGLGTPARSVRSLFSSTAPVSTGSGAVCVTT